MSNPEPCTTNTAAPDVTTAQPPDPSKATSAPASGLLLRAALPPADLAPAMGEGDQADERAPDNQPEMAPREIDDLGCESLEQWVDEVFAENYARRVTGQFRWCAQWWRHTEAVVRLEALWRSWEALRLDKLLGMATWHRDYLDPQLLVLTGATGPFADCQPDRHFAPDRTRLPVDPSPMSWWNHTHHAPVPDGSPGELPAESFRTGRLS